MISSDFRAEARRKLAGKWGKTASITLAYFAIFFVISFIEGFFPDSAKWVFSIVNAVIEIPLGVGLIFAFFKVFNDEDVKAFDFFELGFSNFKKAWGITFQTFLKMIVPVILVIVAYIILIIGTAGAVTSTMFSSSSASAGFTLLTIIGFILLIASMIWAVTKSYYYQLAYIVAAENPDITSKDAVLKSEELMKGNRAKLFYLQLSFIGWSILAAFTFGIGMLWLTPYIQFAIIAFYKYVSENNSAVEVKVEENSIDNDEPIKGND